MEICAWHCCQTEIPEGKKFCTKQCKNKFYVDKRRKDLKQKAIEYKGGKCCICEYDRCAGALEFHHIEPDVKSFGIGMSGYTRSWERVKKELDKCILVCANCHREIEVGFIAPR
jgi:hypothetical protein